MSENKKTRSQVFAELEADKKVIEKHFACVEICEFVSGSYYMLLAGENSDSWTGKEHFYAPDPDSIDQAFEKVCIETKSWLFDKTSCSAPIMHDARECYFQCSVDGKKHYYAAEPKIDAPPKGTPVEAESGWLYRSAGYFEDGLLIVKTNNESVASVKTWRSLTTDHKSADWDGTV